MGVARIRGIDDPCIADYRDIAEAELVRSRGLFVAEGRLIVRRLIEDRRHRIRSVLVSDASYRALQAVLAHVAAETPVYVCDGADFLGITGHDLHRGCLALVERPAARSVGELLATVAQGPSTGPLILSLSKDEPVLRAGFSPAPVGRVLLDPPEKPGPQDPAYTQVQTVVVLEGITNADNVGGVFRNAAAFGANAVVLDAACCDPLYRKAIRTSMAATLRVPYARAGQWPDDLDELRAHGFTIVALTPREPSITLDELAQRPRPPKIAWLVGTEGEGLTAHALSFADQRVRIPIAPEVDSLNLAVAVGIALYRLSR